MKIKKVAEIYRVDGCLMAMDESIVITEGIPGLLSVLKLEEELCGESKEDSSEPTAGPSSGSQLNGGVSLGKLGSANNSGKRYCDLCDKGFRSDNHFKRHIGKHPVCFLCQKRIPVQDEGRRVKPNGIKNRCEHCKEIERRTVAIRKGKKEVLGFDEPEYYDDDDEDDEDDEDDDDDSDSDENMDIEEQNEMEVERTGDEDEKMSTSKEDSELESGIDAELLEEIYGDS